MTLPVCGDERAFQDGPFDILARRQGVQRPFRILVSMPAETRRHLAALLGVRLPHRRLSPPAEAWRIINADLFGLQARSHGPREQLLPYARNHNWWEILLTAARRLELRVYPGLAERDVERLVFAAAARRVLEHLPPEELKELDRLADEEPDLAFTLRELGLSRDGVRLVLAGLGRVARSRLGEAGRALRRAVRTYLERGMEAAGRMPSVARSLRFVKERYLSLVMAWCSMEALWSGLGRARARFLTAVVTLHLHSLLEDGLDEAELLKA